MANAAPLRIALRWVYKNKTLPQQARTLAMLRLAEMPATTSQFRLKPMCVVTGRQRAVVSDYGVSRHIFHADALSGYIEGVQKAMW